MPEGQWADTPGSACAENATLYDDCAAVCVRKVRQSTRAHRRIARRCVVISCESEGCANGRLNPGSSGVRWPTTHLRLAAEPAVSVVLELSSAPGGLEPPTVGLKDGLGHYAKVRAGSESFSN